MPTAAVVKKSIYLDARLDELLRLSAKASGRSVTKQIEYLLKVALDGDNVISFPPTRRPYSGPDPKIKPIPKKLK